MRRLRSALLLSLLVLVCLSVSSLAASSVDVSKALEYIDANRDSILREWVELVQIPAPSREEHKRSVWLRDRFLAEGIKDVKVDEMGNVIAFFPGAGGGPTVMFAAHMDTVFPMDTDLTVTFKDGRMYAPGAGDNTCSVVALLWMVRAFNASGVLPNADLLLVGTVQEEIGLKGMSYLLDHLDRKVDMVVAVDGGFGGVTCGALGIQWWKAVFETPSGHTLSSMGKPSAMKTLGAAISKVYTLQVPQDPPIHLNMGVVGGGTVANAIAGETWVTIDMRSQSAEALKKLTAEVKAKLEEAAKETDAKFTYEVLTDIPAGLLPGATEHKLTVTAVEVLKELGVASPRVGTAGATDANASIARGIYSISVGTTRQGNGHSLNEWAEVESIYPGIKQLIMIATRL